MQYFASKWDGPFVRTYPEIIIMSNISMRYIGVILLSILILGGCSTEPELRTPNPTYDTLAAGCGCGQFIVYRWSTAKSECVVVSAEVRQLGLSTSPTTFDLSASNNWLHVTMEVYAQAVPDRKCDDVIYPNDPKPEIWTASAGSATITVSSDKTPECIGTTADSFSTTITLRDVVFRSPDGGREVTLPEMVFDNIGVGWLPG